MEFVGKEDGSGIGGPPQDGLVVVVPTRNRADSSPLTTGPWGASTLQVMMGKRHQSSAATMPRPSTQSSESKVTAMIHPS